MKKNLLTLSVLLLCAALLLGACSPKEPDPPPIFGVNDEGKPIDLQSQPFLYGSETFWSIPNIAKNPYDLEAFYDDGQFLRYDDGETPVFLGLDVSSHQEDIDWHAVKAAGVDFVMVRVGYRGYTEGRLYIDNQFRNYMQGIEAAGLEAGIYFYSQAITEAEAAEEADTVLEWIEGYDISYPVVFDWEHVYSDDARTNHVTGEEITRFCVTFCDKIQQAGYVPMVYFNRELAYRYYDLAAIDGYYFWLAEYDGAPTFYYDFDMLQYSAEGQIDGVPVGVDLNLCFVDFAAMTKGR